MGPRADFGCRNCGKSHGEPGDAVIVDLPVESKRCPVCGFRRGFRRLFNAVQVSTTGHRIAQRLDPMIQPTFDQATAVKDQARQSERDLVEAHARTVEALPESQRPAMREALSQGPVRFLTAPEAKQAVGMIPPQARMDTRTHIWPHIRRRVVPTPA